MRELACALSPFETNGYEGRHMKQASQFGSGLTVFSSNVNIPFSWQALEKETHNVIFFKDLI